jgi:hypothetical protein
MVLERGGGGGGGDGVALAVAEQLGVAVPGVQLVRGDIVVIVVGRAAGAVGTLWAVTFLPPRPILVVRIVLDKKQNNVNMKQDIKIVKHSF